MKNHTLILLVFTFLSSGPLLSQWINQQIPADIGILLSIDFVNNNSGVSTGWKLNNDAEGRAIYTTNGGLNWYLASLPDSARSLVAVQMMNNLTGYSAGAYNIVSNSSKPTNIQNKIYFDHNRPLVLNKHGLSDSVIGTKAYFLKTTNSGLSWFPYGSMPANSPYVFCMHFVDFSTGFISVERFQNTIFAHGIYKTTNGGINWSFVYSNSDTLTVQGIKFINNNTGFAAGYDHFSGLVPSIQGVMLKTTNSGLNWTKQIFPQVDNFTDISFSNDNTGFASGVDNSTVIYRGIVYKTTNCGNNWIKLSYQVDTTVFEGIEFLPSSPVGFVYGIEGSRDSLFPGFFAYEHLVIAKTTDYGITWTENLSPNTEIFYAGSKMLSTVNWYLTGGSLYLAKIMHTTNGGQIGIIQHNTEIPSEFKLYQNYPNPFNPATTIMFDIPYSDFVKLSIFDALGREISTLVNEQLKPARYEAKWDASKEPSGVYFCKLSSGNYSQTRKLVLLK
jgi:photosystem II stability/assembly factor-like uncharacterized protein